MFCFRCGRDLTNSIFFCNHCGIKIREVDENADKDEYTLIKEYFMHGFNYLTIVNFLLKHHGIEISVRTLKRRLKEQGLKRNDDLPEELLQSIIRREIQGPASLFGYRRLQQHLRKTFKINIPRDRIMNTLKIVDPEGAEQRKSRRLRRQRYVSPGPDHCWHADGYDKLKPFGLPIHGAIDGFSRKVIWLRVTKTNNHPSVIGSFFVDVLKQERKVPDILRTDCRTENGLIAGIQCFLHQNHKAHAYSRSVTNQRIENWWSHMRRGYTGWIINFFKELVYEGSFIPGNNFHMECCWFVFSQFLQKELDSVVEQWNRHRIRSQNHLVNGIPDEMYYLPENFGFEHRGIPLNERVLDEALNQRNVYEQGYDAIQVDEDLREYFIHVVTDENLPYPPGNWSDGKVVFKRIIESSNVF